MRKFNVNVDGKVYAVEIEEVSVAGNTVAQPVSVPIAMPKAVPTDGVSVTSPLPGLILKLSVTDGMSVKKGDKLVVLEAMKMENDIPSPADGRVTFLVKQGDNVETGAKIAVIR